MNHIVDISKIPAETAVSIDDRAFSALKQHDEFRNHRSISTVRVLPFAEYVEITQTNSLKAINSVVIFRNKFIHLFA